MAKMNWGKTQFHNSYMRYGWQDHDRDYEERESKIADYYNEKKRIHDERKRYTQFVEDIEEHKLKKQQVEEFKKSLQNLKSLGTAFCILSPKKKVLDEIIQHYQNYLICLSIPTAKETYKEIKDCQTVLINLGNRTYYLCHVVKTTAYMFKSKCNCTIKIKDLKQVAVEKGIIRKYRLIATGTDNEYGNVMFYHND